MKTFQRLCAVVFLIFFFWAAVLNVALFGEPKANEGSYRVEAKRLADEITDTGSYDLKKYPHITGVFSADEGELYTSDEPYLIIEAKEKLYRIEYSVDDGRKRSLFVVNGLLGILFLLLFLLLFYIRQHILAPFDRLKEVPEELAKGNLAVPVPEEKSRFFGSFTWSIDVLRESIEDSRRKEIAMQREKKMLLLSLSHDIKTPLSAIKLHAKAIAKELHKDKESRAAAAESISAHADEIERFVSEITRAASEDFMNFEVVQGEEFLSRIVEKLSARYEAQLDAAGTEFLIQPYDDCMLSCDPDRLGECLQNLIENAIKYGDGRRIELDFEQMDGCELITVSSTGCMLEPKELPQIFASFHRGSNAGHIQGNGLGLFICKRLMLLMGGEVYADIRDGCFRITLVVRMV